MKKESKHISIVVIAVVFLVLLYLFVGLERPVQVDSGYRPVMGTFARVVVIANDYKKAEECIEAAFIEINEVDDLMSDYKDDSEISLVNKDAFNQPVEVSRPTFDVLQKSVEFSRISAGAFDVTIGPLVDLWHAAAEANSIPAEDELSLARSKVGYEKLILDANDVTVKFTVEGMRIDLGGVAKGYAIDKAIERMQAAGAIGGMVDIGGDVRCFGRPSGKQSWLIALQDPNDISESRFPISDFTVGADTSLLVLQLADAAVATSGGYRRFTSIDGRRFSHIINRRTGESAQSLSSVTVIAPSAIDADALATAVSVLGMKKGLALIESIPTAEAILITPQSEIVKTTGAEKYIE